MKLNPEKAKEVAVKAHGNQSLSDGKPYIVHLENVVRILKEFGHNNPELICAGYLHDTVEDTNLTLDEIEKEFGSEVRDLVWRVTDEQGSNRKERKLKTYPKIKGKALIIKLADRIANVSYSNDPNYRKLYQKEQIDFENYCRVSGEYSEMWDYLNNLLKD